LIFSGKDQATGKRQIGHRNEREMSKKFQLSDYEPVTATAGPPRLPEPIADDRQRGRHMNAVIPIKLPVSSTSTSQPNGELAAELVSNNSAPTEKWHLKKGHSLSFAGLFVFTFLVYFRPYELFPSLSWLSKSALVAALVTLAVFIPTQLGLENRLTAKPREVKLAFLLLLTGILSVPLALEPTRALQSFVDFSKVVLMFIVMVNVLRSEKRLRALILLVLFASCVLSVAALNDYVHGHLALQGVRIEGLIGGLFGNPNDLALHLVTMIPIGLVLTIGSRGVIKKTVYLGCSLLIMAGLVATFSRGGFLGFMCVIAFMVWKLARRNRVIIGAVALTIVLATIAVAPSAYRSRISTTSDDSAIARTDDLKRSILIAARHPLFGVGMDNYILYSNANKATHNAYTQVASEMGIAALLIYVALLLSPFAGLRRIEAAARIAGRKPPIFYLAIGLQASLVGYMVVSFFASVAYLWYVYYLVAYCICLRRISSSGASPANAQSDADKNSLFLTAGQPLAQAHATIREGC
jgi:putative inorganic carbon (HCO3(-)) transporter